jgi:hypothetical protein
MQEYIYLFGEGYNHLLSEHQPFNSIFPLFSDPDDNEEAEQRACELIIQNKLDYEEVGLYAEGKISYDLLYEIAKAEARKDIFEEVKSRGGCDEFC